MTRAVNLNGTVFGRLTVIERGPARGNSTMWLCQCSCGQPSVVATTKLRTGHTKSCGCLRQGNTSNLSHGFCRNGKIAPEYHAWFNAKKRCFDEEDEHYHRYGARGITMCAEWIDDFGAFIAHIGPKPSKELTVDRIDNNRSYEPGNVRWATKSQQAFNRGDKTFDSNERHVHFTHEGTTLTLNAWAKRHGVKSSTLWKRFHKGERPPELFRKPYG